MESSRVSGLRIQKDRATLEPWDNSREPHGGKWNVIGSRGAVWVGEGKPVGSGPLQSRNPFLPRLKPLW